MQRTHKISVTDINPFLVCGLCKGYLIDATTLVDCLHSFCRSCLLKYFASKPERHCPDCNNGPLKKFTGLEFMRQDRHLQSVVYKLVPKLFKDEMKRRKEFYATHSLDDTKGKEPPLSPEKCGEAGEADTSGTMDSAIANPTVSESEMLSICLHFVDGGAGHVGPAPQTPSLTSSSPSTSSSATSGSGASAAPSPNTTGTSLSAADLAMDSFLAAPSPLTFHLLCPASATVGMLQKFVRLKFDLNAANAAAGSRFDVHLFCSDFVDDALPSTYTLHDVACISLWRRIAPLEIAYSIFIFPPEGASPEANGSSTSARSGPENSHSNGRALSNGLPNGHRSSQPILNGVA